MAARTPNKPVPRMTGLPLIGCAHRFRLDPIGVAMELHRRCGDVAELDLGRFGSLYYLFHPDDVGDLLAQGKRLHRELLRKMLGTGLFISQTGDAWRRQRRLLQPAFHASHLPRKVDLVIARVAELLDGRWEALAARGELIDLAEEMKRLTVHVILGMVFGADLLREDPPIADALSFVVDYVDRHIFALARIPLSWPTPENRRFREALALLEETTMRSVAARRARRELGDDLLGMFIAARDGDTGEPMTDKELLDEVLSTFVAGTETTGAALTWTFYLLCKHPAFGRRLQDEVDQALGVRRLTAGDLPALKLARNAVLETMRLYPPAWALFRVLETGREFRGYRLPDGARVMVSPFATHRHPAFWEAPGRFDPDRFTPERSAERPRFAYFPFGGGPHQCVGSELASTEAQVIVAMVAQRFELELDSAQVIGMEPTIALSPRPSPRVRLCRRADPPHPSSARSGP